MLVGRCPAYRKTSWVNRILTLTRAQGSYRAARYSASNNEEMVTWTEINLQFMVVCSLR